ncbi:MAG: pyridoxamine 5-phosphate oxidase, partial [Alphaproteobacteria bacterium]|nr:pyridoxamine 5-phosphate oxidase [Alphaproteobacteria bacterium]
SFLIKDASIDRTEIIRKLTEAHIDTRPIVAGNFAKKEVVRYFDHEISGELKNADYIDEHGFFVGNHQFDIRDKIDYLKQTLDNV